MVRAIGSQSIGHEFDSRILHKNSSPPGCCFCGYITAHVTPSRNPSPRGRDLATRRNTGLRPYSSNPPPLRGRPQGHWGKTLKPPSTRFRRVRARFWPVFVPEGLFFHPPGTFLPCFRTRRLVFRRSDTETPIWCHSGQKTIIRTRKRSFGVPASYSFFNSVAGLVRAALRVCQRTARKEMRMAITAPTTNTHP